MKAALEKTYRLSEACLPYLCASVLRLFRVALRQEQAAEVGAENAMRSERGRRPPPRKCGRSGLGLSV